MAIQKTIDQDFLKARKAKKQPECLVLSLIKSALKNQEIAKKAPLTDQEISQVLRREIKSRNDAIQDYKKGERPELAKKEAEEIKVIEKYLPQMLGEAQIKTIVTKTIKELKATGPQDFGKVMGKVMEKTKGQADGKLVSQIVKANLS